MLPIEYVHRWIAEFDVAKGVLPLRAARPIFSSMSKANAGLKSSGGNGPAADTSKRLVGVLANKRFRDSPKSIDDTKGARVR